MTVQRGGGLAPITSVFVLHILQSHMMRPYVPLFAASLDVGYLGVGVVAAALGFLPMFFALPIGNHADRWGPKPLIIVGAGLNAAAFTLLWAYPNLMVIIVSQLMAGLANLLLNLSTQTYVGGLGRGRAAERNFATFSMFASIGQIGGPLLGGVIISLFGFGAVFLTAAILSALCVTAALLLLPKFERPVNAAPRRGTALRAWEYLKARDTQLVILASCLMAIPEILRTSFLPLYLGEVVQLDPALVGWVLAIFAVAGLVAKSVLPLMVGRFGRQVMLFAFTVGCALAIMAIPLTASIWVVCIITLCMGLTFGLGRPLSMAMAANASLPGELGFVVAIRLSGNRLADFVLPVAFGTAATLAGIGAIFVTGGAIMLLGAIALIPPMRDERRGHLAA